MKRKKLFSTIKILGIFWIISTVIAMFLGADTEIATGNVAVVPIYGIITTTGESDFTSSVVSSEKIIKSLDKADKNPNIKAIVLDINSPGGSGVAADEISQKIKSIDKFTIAVIRDVGASAAYWVASSTDYIYANRLSFTGSIGVIGSYLDISGFLHEHNITYQRYVSGELKDMGSPFKEPSEVEKQVYQQLINKMRDLFVQEVAVNRDLEIKTVNEMATGQVFLGIEAKDLMLIDDVGTKQDAIEFIEQKFNLTAEPVEYKEKKSLSELLYGFTSSFRPEIDKFINPANPNPVWVS